MRLTLDEYSKRFKMSKEMINSKLKAKKLNYIVENNTTYIITRSSTLKDNKSDSTAQKESSNPIGKAVAKPKTTVAMVLALYQRENATLKGKIAQLESKIDKLIDDKEQMLRAERDKIEDIYTSKDRQLKNILELINRKLMLEEKPQTIHEVQTIQDQEITYTQESEETEEKTPKIVELTTHLKSLGLRSWQRKVIKQRFLNIDSSDIRVIKQNGKLYLDFSKYDYSDLLEH
ncbi:MAG: hypothetical protein U9Q29_04790 [Campylobacterota bacterium]|nr:hypothetical protein [Campylobacterota bacterium]